MKKFVALMMALVICMGVTAALAAGKLNIVQENYHTVESYTPYGYVYAKVENSGDKPIKVNAGVLEIYDEAGDVITSADYLYANAEYLQPGEYTYIEMYEDMDKDAKPADYMLTLTGKSDDSVICKRLPCQSELQLDVVDGWWEYNYMIANVTNDTDEVVYDLRLVFAVMDEAGNIIYMDDDRLYDQRGINPGSSMTFRFTIDSSFIEHFDAQGITPAAIDVLAYYEVEVGE